MVIVDLFSVIVTILLFVALIIMLLAIVLPQLKDSIVRLYEKTGRIDERNIVLGYDYGLFLYALAEYGHPLAAEIYRKMMDLRDSSLSWVEYYVDGKPFNTPCRPWESSINIVSALKYAGVKAPVR